MARTLTDKLAQLPHGRRDRIERHARALIAKEMSLRKLRRRSGARRQVAPKGGLSRTAAAGQDLSVTETPIAERQLLFSVKGESERKPLVIRIFASRPVDPASVSFQVAAGTAVCAVEFDGIPGGWVPHRPWRLSPR
jgi:hypothetical protein